MHLTSSQTFLLSLGTLRPELEHQIRLRFFLYPYCAIYTNRINVFGHSLSVNLWFGISSESCYILVKNIFLCLFLIQSATLCTPEHVLFLQFSTSLNAFTFFSKIEPSSGEDKKLIKFPHYRYTPAKVHWIGLVIAKN